jgi:group I intron endonuclease
MQLPARVTASGIYVILNTVLGLRYYGSSRNIADRLCHHKRALERGNHDNPYLQNHYKLYGAAAFVASIIELSNPEELKIRETWWVEKEGTLNRIKGYNLRHPAEIGHPKSSRKGIPLSAETRARIAATLTGRKATKETKAKMREGQRLRVVPPNTGKIFSAAWKAALSAGKKGKPKPVGFGAKIREALTGKSKSAAHCKSISLSKLGKLSPNPS